MYAKQTGEVTDTQQSITNGFYYWTGRWIGSLSTLSIKGPGGEAIPPE